MEVLLGSLTVRYYIRRLGMSGLREARYSGLFGLLVGTVPRLSLTSTLVRSLAAPSTLPTP